MPYGNLKSPSQPCFVSRQYVETRTIAAARYLVDCVQGRHQLPIKMPCMPQLSRPCLRQEPDCPYSRRPLFEGRLCELHRKNR
jgi:hypothetical protein